MIRYNTHQDRKIADQTSIKSVLLRENAQMIKAADLPHKVRPTHHFLNWDIVSLRETTTDACFLTHDFRQDREVIRMLYYNF